MNNTTILSLLHDELKYCRIVDCKSNGNGHSYELFTTSSRNILWVCYKDKLMAFYTDTGDGVNITGLEPFQYATLYDLFRSLYLVFRHRDRDQDILCNYVGVISKSI